MSNIKIQEVVVTPKQAAEWLEVNHPENRAMSTTRIDAIVGDILGGRWVMTHQGICFDQDGWLIDGQHRLKAVVKANKGVPMLVFTNPSGKITDPLDRGSGRSVGQLMHLSNTDVTVLNVLFSLETGAAYKPCTLGVAQEVFSRHKLWIDLVHKEVPLKGTNGGMRAAAVWCAPFALEYVSALFTGFVTGIMLEEGSPALSLRRLLERGEIRRQKFSPYQMCTVTLSCIRAVKTKRTMKKLYLDATTAYSWSCEQRRAKNIPHTPSFGGGA